MTQQTGALNKAIYGVEEQGELLRHLYVKGKRRNGIKLLFISTVASPEETAK